MSDLQGVRAKGSFQMSCAFSFERKNLRSRGWEAMQMVQTSCHQTPGVVGENVGAASLTQPSNAPSGWAGFSDSFLAKRKEQNFSLSLPEWEALQSLADFHLLSQIAQLPHSRDSRAARSRGLLPTAR